MARAMLMWVKAFSVDRTQGCDRRHGNDRYRHTVALKATTAHGSIVRRELLPFALAFAGLVAATLAIDAALHLAGLVWIGRYLGIVGTALILGSFGYAAAKRKWITPFNPAVRLRKHERMTWIGALLILVHAGVHFGAVLAWLAVGAMLINVASGLTGKYLLQRARARMGATRTVLAAKGLEPETVEARLYWDSLTYNVIKQWRALHVPITLAFGVLAFAHIIAIALFWGWH
jgi:hypothetical protein